MDKQNSEDIVFCHKNIGIFDTFITDSLINYKSNSVKFFIYNFNDWYKIRNSKFIKLIKQNKNFSINVYFGSLRSSKGYINSSLIVKVLFLLIKVAELMGVKQNRVLILIYNILLIGNNKIRNIKINKYVKKNSNVWLEWSSLSNIGISIFNSININRRKINMFPDAPIVEKYHSIKNNINLFRNSNIHFHLQDQSMIDIFKKDYPEFKDNISKIYYFENLKKFKKIFDKNFKNQSKKSNLCNILFLAQKKTIRKSINNNKNLFIDLDEHRSNLINIFESVSENIQKQNIQRKKIQIIYREHPNNSHYSDWNWVRKSALKYNIPIKNTTHSGIIWDDLMISDLAISEFTSAFILSSILDRSYMIRNKSFDYFYKFKPIKKIYQEYLKSEKIIHKDRLSNIIKEFLM